MSRRPHAEKGLIRVSTVIGMATTKVTVTLQDEQMAEIPALANAGSARNASAFVQHAV